jgi:ubiquinone/menaquinone biosynthesis C-methylase UbiE
MNQRSPSLDSAFHAHYNDGVERNRLLHGTSSLEYFRTKQILSRYLPKKHATIIDIGGGPGRYSFWLAEKGYNVHLVDVMPLHIKQAQTAQRTAKRRLASITLGDARNLEFEDRSADIALLFGPLYHLVERNERLEALSETYRVLKPGGMIFAAGISRFTSALDGSRATYIRDPEFMNIIRQDLRNGQHRNPRNVPEYFTTAFFHHPAELVAEIQQTGFKSVRVHAVTGFAWLLPSFHTIWKNRKLRTRLLAILETTELEPSLIGVSDHLLAIARK